MLARLHHVIVDCPDALALAQFYSALLGKPVTFSSEDFCVVSDDQTTSGIGFQRVDDYQAPRWPSSTRPQQMHFDIMVDDVEAADDEVIELGATRLSADDHVYADPVGHPFCLVPRPSWAEPLAATGDSS